MNWKLFIFLIIFCLTIKTPVTVAQGREQLFEECYKAESSRKSPGAKNPGSSESSMIV
jgi:hypothetical protein